MLLVSTMDLQSALTLIVLRWPLNLLGFWTAQGAWAWVGCLPLTVMQVSHPELVSIHLSPHHNCNAVALRSAACWLAVHAGQPPCSRNLKQALFNQLI